MAITTFVASQILTAAQMNAVQSNDFNQTVSTKTASYTLVAADKGTRVVMNSGSATTITVNTSLFSAGDTLVLQNIGAGVCTVTAGTATVSSAGPLAIPQNGSGLLYFTSAGVSIFYPSAVTAATVSSGLTLIATATATAVSSISVDNCFTSTYENYRIVFAQTDATAATNQDLKMRLRVAGTDTTSNYSNTVVEGVSSFGVSVDPAGTDEWYLSGMNGTGKTTSVSIDVYRPQTAQITGFNGQYQYRNVSPALTIGLSTGVQKDATQFDGFSLLFSGTDFTGIARVYGYSNS